MEAMLASAMSHVFDVFERGSSLLQPAAATACQPELRAMFARRAGEHARASTELQTLLSKLGGISHHSPRPTAQQGLLADGSQAPSNAAAHPAGEESPSDLALLEACERLEIIALETYGRALRVAAPHPLRYFLEFQRATASANLACVRAVVRAAMQRQCDDVRRNRAHVHGLREHVLSRTGHP